MVHRPPWQKNARTPMDLMECAAGMHCTFAELISRVVAVLFAHKNYNKFVNRILLLQEAMLEVDIDDSGTVDFFEFLCVARLISQGKGRYKASDRKN